MRPACRAPVAVLLAMVAASCAAHRVAPPALDTGSAAARYAGALARREAMGGAVDAEVSAWLRGDAVGDIPGMHATLAVSGPDAFRLRVDSMFGVALDCAAHGDSLAAYVPARRVGIRLDAAVDSLGLRSPGALGYRVLSASWRPPAAAWALATTQDSLRVVSWEEAGDSLSIAIGANGLPRIARFHRRPGVSVRATYRGWTFVEGAAWPAMVELQDEAGRFKLILRLTRVWRNQHPAPERFVVRIPDGAERLEWSQVRRAIERARGL